MRKEAAISSRVRSVGLFLLATAVGVVVNTHAQTPSLRGNPNLDPPGVGFKHPTPAIQRQSVGDDYSVALEAEAAYQQRDWAKAAELYARVTGTNPQRGQYWYRQGYSYYRIKQYDKAIAAWKRSAELGANKNASIFNIAAAYALSGDSNRAFEFIDRALAMRWPDRRQLAEDEDFKSLRNDTRFAARAGLPPNKSASRNAAWRFDIAFAAAEIKRIHIEPFRVVSERVFDNAVRALSQRVSSLSDNEIIVGLFRLFAMIGDGHTLLFFPESGRYAFHRLPIYLEEFKEGFFVTATTAEHRALLGAKVTRIGHAVIDFAAEKMNAIMAGDNRLGQRRYLPLALTYAELLHGLRLTDRSDSISIDAISPKGEPLHTVLFPLAHNDSQKFIGANTADGQTPPLWLKNESTPYWFEWLPDRRTVFFQFNANEQMSSENFEAFTRRLFSFIETHDVAKLVVDLRHNDGGTNLINRYLVLGIIQSAKINRRGALFVMISRQTFSAAMNLAADLERWTNAIFVGEPTGSSPNFVGDTTRIVLPYSELRGSASNNRWQNALAFDDRTWIGPQFLYEPTFADWLANRDPALDAVLAFEVKEAR